MEMRGMGMGWLVCPVTAKEESVGEKSGDGTLKSTAGRKLAQRGYIPEIYAHVLQLGIAAAWAGHHSFAIHRTTCLAPCLSTPPTTNLCNEGCN